MGSETKVSLPIFDISGPKRHFRATFTRSFCGGMQWIEKRPESSDANLKQDGLSWLVRVRLHFAEGTVLEQRVRPGGKVAVYRLRHSLYDEFNETALAVLARERAPTAEIPPLTLRDAIEQCQQKIQDDGGGARPRGRLTRLGTFDVGSAVYRVIRLRRIHLKPSLRRTGRECRTGGV